MKNENNSQYIYERLNEWLFYFQQNLRISILRRLYIVSAKKIPPKVDIFLIPALYTVMLI